MIAAALLALEVSAAHAQLGSVISASSLPADKRQNSARVKVTPKRNLVQRDNLEGLKRCRKNVSSTHFDCLRREISKLEKKSGVSVPKPVSLYRPQASLSLSAKFLSPKASHFYFPKQTAWGFKSSHALKLRGLRVLF